MRGLGPGLEGRSVLVTGAASGIGRAIALRLGAAGARVVILDRNGAGAQAAADAIVAAGGHARAITLDITDFTACDAAVEAAAADGPLHGLVNNAGWDRAMPFLATDPAFWKQVIDINLYGPLNITHAVLRRLVAAGNGGRIVSIASDAGRIGSTGEAVYSAAKGGTIALMKTLAREHARAGITFNTVCPGVTDTPLLQSFDPEGTLVQKLVRTIPMRRIGTPDDYPGIVAFLLGDDAAFITGQTISVSGGSTMHG